MKGQPTPWRASKAANGSWRVIRTTFLGYATRVEVLVENCPTWSRADALAMLENTK